jgi:hypothetical protein
MFETPIFTFGAVVYTAIGAIVLWGKMKIARTPVKAYVIGDIISKLPLSPGTRSLIEFGIFVIVGCVVGIGLTQPTNARQALTAGIAWTSFFSTPRGSHKSLSKS